MSHIVIKSEDEGDDFFSDSNEEENSEFDDDEWDDVIKKQVAMQLIDTGDGIQIIGLCTKKEINYLEAEQLHILLRLASVHCVYQIAEPTPKKDF